MIVNKEEALAFYRTLPSSFRLPYAHPDYVTLEAEREGGEARFWIDQQKDSFYYHPFIEINSVVKGEEITDRQSCYGYGGPITNGDVSQQSDFTNRYIQAATNEGVLVEFIRFHPIIHANYHYYGRLIPNRATVALDLAGEWRDDYRSLAKRTIKKAKQLYRAQVTDAATFLHHFPSIYEELMSELAANEFYFFDEAYWRAIAQLDVASFIVVYEQETIVGGAILLLDGQFSEYHLGAMRAEARRNGGMYVLVDFMAQFSHLAGMRYLQLGGGTDSSTQNPLLFFKSRFVTEIRHQFNIGAYVFQQEKYDQLKREVDQPERIIFYR